MTAAADLDLPLVASGKSLAEVQAAKPTAAFDAAWGKGFLKPDRFVEIVYTDYSRQKSGSH